jgi:PAS domain S-box-containing protein
LRIGEARGRFDRLYDEQSSVGFWGGIMTGRSSSNLGMGLRVFSWPTALIAIVVIKAVLSLAVKPGSFLVSYSGISYFLLLLLATGFAIRNGIQDTLGGRPFWVFLAIAYGLWLLEQGISLYYECGLHIEVPNNSIADPVLFLHIVPLMAAVATLPHRNVSDRRPYRAISNFFLLLFFWSFIYGYTVFPYQYLFSNTAPPSYDLRFDILYLLENLALVLAVGILTLRVHAPWKSIYFHLLGASTLYALSSTVANIAIDSGGYVNGKLYGLGLTASVCWFVWIPLRARQLSGTDVRATRSAGSQGSQASAWAMLVVVMISIPIVWELFQRNESTGIRTLRLLVAFIAIVCLASTAYIKEYLAKRELASHVGIANDRLRLAMESGKSVGWDWDVKSGRDVWFGDLKTMFGIPSDTYVGRVEDFRRRVHPDDRGKVWKAANDAMQSHQQYAAEFRILWPDGTMRWVAAEGKFYYSVDDKAERMLGMAVDVTDRKRMEEALRESEERLRLAAEAGRIYAFEWDVATDAVVRSPESVNILGMAEPIRTTRQHMLSTVHPDDRARVTSATSLSTPENPISRVSYRLFCSDGSMIWVEKTARAFFDEHGKMLRVVGMVADVTERKRAEEALSSLNRRAIEAEEREHNRIARDLHEDIGQRLALLAIEIEQLKTDPPNEADEIHSRMDALWKRTLEILTDVKASAHELHSPRLEYLGIAEVMRCFCQEFGARKRVEIDFSSRGLPGLVLPDVSICLFRVLQEALYNGMQHSGVQQFEVQLWGTADELHLTVSDSGTGFDLEAARRGQGLGLIRMEERLKLVKGTFSIESQPKRGTTIHALVPLSSGSDSMRAAG